VCRRRAEKFALATTAHPVDQAHACLRISRELGRQTSEKWISELWLKRARQVEYDVELVIGQAEHAGGPSLFAHDALGWQRS
jgi:hypothetical protein